MRLEIDNDVKAVIEMMLATIPANRLVSVANGVQKIAPILWGQYESETVQPIALRHSSISACGQRMQPSATEPHLDS